MLVSHDPVLTTDMAHHINLSQFAELRDLLEEDLSELLQTYMQDSEQRLAEMQTALSEQNSRLGFEAAHSLKGASANLGATVLTELCSKLQEAFRHGQGDEQALLIDAATTESRIVNTYITALIANNHPNRL